MTKVANPGMRSLNPLLPKKQKGLTIRWRTGPSAGMVGITPKRSPSAPTPESVSAAADYKKDPRGRKPKSERPVQPPRERMSMDRLPEPPSRPHADAGLLRYCTGSFIGESNSGWGANLDMAPLVHGPVGCGVFSQATRFVAPGFVQGVDGFAELHACTDLRAEDMDDDGDVRLARALDELKTLFPLARGATILNEDPIALMNANARGVAKIKARALDMQIIPIASESARITCTYVVDTAAALKAAQSREKQARSSTRDVALTFYRDAAGLVWIVDRLLRDIGLRPIHVLTGSSSSDLAKASGCKLVIGFSLGQEPPRDLRAGGYAQLLHTWFGAPIQWTCFAGPSATDAALRAVAAHFGPQIQARAERVIAKNRAATDAVVARYRPRLQGKLLLHFKPMTQDQLEPFRLLGMRIGDVTGWTGKTGARRQPRRVCDGETPSAGAVEAYLAEAAPDLVLGLERDEYDWRKRGFPALPLSPLFDRKGNHYWGYDGFARLADALDRHLTAPWRGLLRAPWMVETSPRLSSSGADSRPQSAARKRRDAFEFS
ncbi:nitrogenase protein alpha chain [Methylosinus sp. C49]|nr:nitrogenase protein alpha chain [Methylosinus sp. C49]